ncbi:hypothetical protein TCAL_01132 [Tigriopus californicus]|uniref:Uncharacterized protein n=1 Tax=Tigriopus californicus TaxID=6832 RepID=A0A553P4U4_TIGCA|nr:WAS/WASL-interacting protein family member 2-like [Tigriopus californicus]TRY72709.1 hypothetical protein TCAL_01132 [Tigriopus californicus]|eukprot:TCALIF_01132-PA protein Name:"Protein of unknown function" AED:0.00 eAED:0.00 QI:85/1/1/1/0/0.5/2/344/108
MLVFPKGYHQANVQPPKLTPEEEAQRQALLQSVREHDKKALQPTETDDRSAPLRGGRNEVRSVPKANRGGRKGPPGALGDLFSGGIMPNPGALRGGRGGGGGRGARGK